VTTRGLLEPTPLAEPRERRGRGAANVLWIAVALTLAIFLLYLLKYPLEHARMPAGFDAAWYVWRARFVAANGVGPFGTAYRPGHAVLSALLGSVSGTGQLQLFVVFSELLPALLALAVGAFGFSALRRDRPSWAITIGLTGAALGATRLVGENIANLLNLTLEVGALAILISAWSRRRAIAGAVLMLVAAGLSHWLFLAVLESALAVAVLLSWFASRSRSDWKRLAAGSDARSITTVGVATAAALGFLIMVVLRGPLATFEIQLNPLEFAPKLLTDLARLWPLGLLAAIGIVPAVALARADGELSLERRMGTRLLVSWGISSLVGLLVGLVGFRVTSHLSLPPHRFLTLLAALPGVILAGAGVRWLQEQGARRLLRRFGGPVATGLSACVVVASVIFVLLPSVFRWYRYPVLMGSVALKQASVAAEYVDGLPPGQAFVVVVDANGPADDYAAPLRERMIRMELSPDRQADLHLFPGYPTDLLARRRTFTGHPLTTQVTLPYWRDVSPLLSAHPPILAIQAMGATEFDQTLALGGRQIATGVALLQGPLPNRGFSDDLAPDASVTVITVLRGMALMALLWAAGWGWTRLLFGPETAPEVWLALAPTIGMGVLLLGAFTATELGLRMGGAGGPVTYAVVTVVGLAAWHRGRGDRG